MNRMFARPEVPQPVSEWRRNILRICAEDRQVRRYSPVVRTAAPIEHKTAKKPRIRKRKIRTLCQCGKVILVAGQLWCCICRNRPKQVGISKLCVVCGKQLNLNNVGGYCRNHSNKARREIELGKRTTCSFKADGMRCIQVLYRTNTSGLCLWHVKKPKKDGAPRMEHDA